ncbi:MAG: hypothetical protein RSC66_03640, partial [Comamonas sp.]
SKDEQSVLQADDRRSWFDKLTTNGFACVPSPPDQPRQRMNGPDMAHESVASSHRSHAALQHSS